MSAKRILTFFLVILLLGLFSYFYPNIQTLTGQATQSTSTEYPKETAILARVVDGDTIVYRIGNISLSCRLLGINAPEKKMPMANESRRFLEQFVNQTIYLQRDVEDEDKYDRKLRYVFAGEEGERFLNLELLENGYVSSYIFGEQSYTQEILRAEEQARNLGLGIWEKSKEECAINNCIKLNELNSTAEYFIIENICSSSCSMDGWFVKDTGRNTFYLNNLTSGNQEKYNSTEVWNNDHDSFFMFDEEGKIVIFYAY